MERRLQSGTRSAKLAQECEPGSMKQMPIRRRESGYCLEGTLLPGNDRGGGGSGESMWETYFFLLISSTVLLKCSTSISPYVAVVRPVS